ncbi:glutaminase [Oleiagrimonas sp. C23AA]|uniref:glutaminase n=1 Tax=Oleiagrimonas sp. C23AA TaxID=2719047 RepID=UPI0014243FAF|nr:glutaminase [Oleiagrimonas sp. C23AA]NII11939.1 glutaminase [Oleiagrimonas sp. C23AA]
MPYQAILEQIHAEIAPTLPQGRMPDYIPQLASVEPTRFGMAVCDTDGHFAAVGDAEERFSIQSISKVFTLTLAMQREGEALWRRVGREPSGTAFNSLVQLEFEHGIPRNPFINAGALVVTDMVISHQGDAKAALRDFARRLCGDDDVDYDYTVAESEAAKGHRNAAVAHFLKSFGNLDNHPDAVLDAYFHHCALSMSCAELARTFMYLARYGRNADGPIVTPSQAKYINSLMLTCGTYDAVGDFAYRVGLPAKSGVGGGIVAVMPGQFSVCVWAPGLNASGNSLAGTLALERFATLSGHSIF